MKNLTKDSLSIRNLHSSKKSISNIQGMSSSRSTKLITNYSTNLSNNCSTNISNNSMNIDNYYQNLIDKENISHFHLNKQYSTISNISFKDDLVRTDSVISLLQQPNKIQQQSSINQSCNQQTNEEQSEQVKSKQKANLHRRVQSTISLASNGSNKSDFQSSSFLNLRQQEKLQQIKQQKMISKTLQEAQNIIQQKQIQLEDIKKENQKLSQKLSEELKLVEDINKRINQQERFQIPMIAEKHSPNLDQLTQLAIEREQIQSQIYQKLKQINEERQQMIQKLDTQTKQIQFIQVQNQKSRQHLMQIDKEQSSFQKQKVQEYYESQKKLQQLVELYNKLKTVKR